ncbi:MAG: hypothetical protein AB1485_06030 [Candidatus Thermoplasmatota archaeon]
MQDKEGIARLIEFLMVFAIFIVIIGGFYAIVNIYRLPVVSYLEEDTIRLGEVLISHPGKPDDWENNTTILNNLKLMSSLGLAINSTVSSAIRNDNQSYGILYWNKTVKLHELRNNFTAYENIIDLLRLKEKGYHLNITLTNLTDGNKYYFGNETAGKLGYCWKRIVVMYDPDKRYDPDKGYIPFIFDVRLAKRE